MPHRAEVIRSSGKFAAVTDIEHYLSKRKTAKEHFVLKYVKPVAIDYMDYSCIMSGETWEMLVKYTKRFPAVVSVLVSIKIPGIEHGPGSVSMFQVDLLLSGLDHKTFVVADVLADSYSIGEDEEVIEVRNRYIRLFKQMFNGTQIVVEDTL